MSDECKPSLPRSALALWLEIGLVLLLCVVPNLFNAIAYSMMKVAGSGTFAYRSLALTVQSVGAIALISFIIWRSGEGAERFGVSRPRLSDLAGAIGVYVAMHIGNYVLWYGLMVILGRSRMESLAHVDLSAIAAPNGSGEFVLLSVMSLTNGIAEELVCRSYLITRFEQVFRSTPLAWLLSSLLFSSYHIYQGTGGAISELGIGLTFGAIFILFRRVWPLAIGHAFQDLVAIAMMGH